MLHKILDGFARMISPGLMARAEVESLIEEKVLAARQAMPINADYDPKGEGFRPLAGAGQSQRRDLLTVNQSYMLELAYYLYDTSGLVKRFVKDTKNFVLGEGLTFEVQNDTEDNAAKQVLDDFWTDPMNQGDLRLDKRIEFLGLLGEQCWPVTINPHNGRVWWSYVDPANIADVILVRNFPEMVAAVDLVGSGGRPGQRLTAVRTELDPRKAEFGRLVGDCFFLSVNNPPNAPRGRSDLIHVFDFINAFEEGLFDELDRLKQIKAFIWDVKMDGATPEEVEEFAKKLKTPKSGSVRVHNERMEWQAIAPDLKMGDNKNFFELMKSYLCACMNRPDSWLGSGGKAYQTEADLMGEPTFKDLGSRQRYVQYQMAYVGQFVVDQAVIHKTLPDRKYKVLVNMPEMSTKDLKKIVDGLFTLAQGLMIAENQSWVTGETASKVFASVAGQTGIEVEAAEEIKKAARDPNMTEDYAAREARIKELEAKVAALKGAEEDA